VLDALDRLAEGAESLDIKALQGAAPWLRLRVGDVRVLYRPMTSDEVRALPGSSSTGYLVARIVNRRNLERAMETL
jgi:hypothetical protein